MKVIIKGEFDIKASSCMNESNRIVTLETADNSIDERHAILTDEPTRHRCDQLVMFSSSPRVELLRELDTRTLLVGTRSWTDKDQSYLRYNKISMLPAKRIAFEDLQDSCDAAMELSRGKITHLLVFLDVLDPVYYPNEEPGGLSTRELIYFIQRFRIREDVRSLEVVCSKKGEKIALKLIREFG